MKRRFAILAVILGTVSFVACHDHPMFAQEKVESARIAGKWQMTMDTPHGAVNGDLQVEQDGPKVSGTYTVEHMGSMNVSGKVDGKKVSFSVEVPGANMSFAFNGTVEGDKMSGKTEQGGSWTAERR